MTPAAPLRSGWILVVGLVGLCVLGTWMTSRNYHGQVFTSTRATVLANQWPESRIAVEFSTAETPRIRPGMIARITVGNDKTLVRGRVYSVGVETNSESVVIAVTGEFGNACRPDSDAGKIPHYLPAGAPCAVTVDTTIPPEVLASPSPSTSQMAR